MNVHPEAIADVRRRHPSMDDLPDEAVAKLGITHATSVALYVRDAGRATSTQATRTLIAFGDVMTAWDASARARWRDFWRRRGH